MRAYIFFDKSQIASKYYELINIKNLYNAIASRKSRRDDIPSRPDQPIRYSPFYLQLHHLGADDAWHLFQLLHDLIGCHMIHAQNHELRLALCNAAHMHTADIDLSFAQNHAAGADDIGPVLDDGHHHVSLGGDVGMVLVELDDALLLAGDSALQYSALVPLVQLEGDGIAVSVGRLRLALHELDPHLLEGPLGIDEVDAAVAHDAAEQADYSGDAHRPGVLLRQAAAVGQLQALKARSYQLSGQ